MHTKVSMTNPTRPSNADVVIDELTDSLRTTAKQIVPWFLTNMPLMYFQDTDHVTQLAHLRAIIAAKASDRPIEITLRSEDGTQRTLMRPLDYPGVLAELVRELPYEPPLRSAKIHTATDGRLVLDTFEFGDVDRFNPDDPDQVLKLRDTIEYAAKHEPDFSPNEITQHFNRCSAEYTLNVTPLRICTHWRLFERLTGTEGTAVVLEEESNPTQSRIVLGVGNAATRTMLERIATLLSQSLINIHRAYLDTIDDGLNGSISLLGFVVQGPDGGPIDQDSELWQSVRRDLNRLKWFDQRTLDLAYAHSDLDLEQSEVITALSDLAHQVLVPINPYAFNPDRIRRFVVKHLPQARRIAALFYARFDPSGALGDDEFDQQASTLCAEIESNVDHADARMLLTTMVQAVRSVLRTNVFLERRYALSMRLDPKFLATEQRKDIPFGVYFVHGRSFDGFHVRFRDIARGGLRVIKPLGTDQYALAQDRLYDEAYSLAHAQQLKNKDIPEGGAKAAILVEPHARVTRSVKAFVDGILDLITPDPSTRDLIVDRLGFDELLYLGPDENITPDLIEWIVDRARQRGYPSPTALMSSKPGAGINHKMYGVTSEGVTVFLDVALRSIGIDPKTQPFTIKITGGPDGDVAGNEIKILKREYGDNAKIVGIADGSGCAENPDGLNIDELLRLVECSLPISSFDRTRLGSRGRLVTLEEPDGVHLRNTMHFRVVADAFIPAGGRPNTINENNWKDYLSDDQTPSSKVIVEGANLFLTPEARLKLSEHEVLIIKDSSANKCGVICSSFEILASMLLSEEEFLTIKATFVEQVLLKLRTLARREAELLLREHRYHPDTSLPTMSVRLSHVMMKAADAIEQAIDQLDREDTLLIRQLVIDHLPPILVNTAGERLWTLTPKPYLKWIMAKSLAGRIVYREGVEYLDQTPERVIAELAVKYLRLEQERSKLVDEITASNLPNRDRIASLLTRAGILSTIGDNSP